MSTPFNVMNSRIGDQSGNNVRASEIIKQLERLAQEFGQGNWSILEIFTLTTKIAEMGVQHAKEHKVAFPKTFEITAQDGSQITLGIKSPKSQAQIEMERQALLQTQFGKPN